MSQMLKKWKCLATSPNGVWLVFHYYLIIFSFYRIFVFSFYGTRFHRRKLVSFVIKARVVLGLYWNLFLVILFYSKLMGLLSDNWCNKSLDIMQIILCTTSIFMFLALFFPSIHAKLVILFRILLYYTKE